MENASLVLGWINNTILNIGGNSNQLYTPKSNEHGTHYLLTILNHNL